MNWQDSGGMILAVSGGHQSQEWGGVLLAHHLGDFDHDKIMRPEEGPN